MEKYDMKNPPCVMLLHHLGHVVRYQAMDQLEKYDLKPSQAGILFILDSEGMLSQRELAEKMCVKPPSMTVALQKMEKNEYVTRKPDQEDQRIIRITLTEKGKNCVGEIKQALDRMEERMFRNFSQEERILVRRFLIQMMGNFMETKTKFVTERIDR